MFFYCFNSPQKDKFVIMTCMYPYDVPHAVFCSVKHKVLGQNIWASVPYRNSVWWFLLCSKKTAMFIVNEVHMAVLCFCIYACDNVMLYLFIGDYAGFPGCGLLRLHSTYRHDLKIYASDEGRVQMTAAAFAKVHSPNPLTNTGHSKFELNSIMLSLEVTNVQLVVCLAGSLGVRRGADTHPGPDGKKCKYERPVG